MNWITEKLGVAGAMVESVESLFQQADWVVNVAQEISYGSSSFPPIGKGYIKYGGVFGSDFRVKPLITAIHSLLTSEERVIVHCAAGMNRAPAVAICVLMDCGVLKPDAIRFVLAKRPGCEPFMDIVSRYEEEVND